MIASDVRTTYRSGIGAVVHLITDPTLRDRWDQPSVLDGWHCGLVAAHVARSVLQVEWFLDADEPPDPTVTAVSYYSGLTGIRDSASALNIGVRARSEETAALGWTGLVDEVTACAERISVRLSTEPATRCVTAFGRPMLLDEYLPTRLVEMSVHGDDLALSLGIENPIPASCMEVAVAVLEAVALATHGPLAVLRALARRERDPVEALRVL